MDLGAQVNKCYICPLCGNVMKTDNDNLFFNLRCENCNYGMNEEDKQMSKIRVYLASQIFAECWRDYNEKIANKIRERFPNIELYVPQENKSINDKTKCADAEDICKGDFTNNLDKDDIMIAIVDGDTPGIGTVTEIGYFARICEEEIQRFGSTKKKIISLYTDSRECSNTVNEGKINKLNEFAECQFSYLNLLTVGVLKRYGTMCRTIDELLDELEKAIGEYSIDKKQFNKEDGINEKM